MNYWRRNWRLGGVALAMALFTTVATAADGTVVLAVSNNAVFLKVDGDKDDDWWLQTSTNLTTWSTLTNFGTLLSGNETNAPWRSAGTESTSPTYYRALQTDGLYDPGLFRTVSLIYTQANAAVFSNAMHVARATGSNIYLPLLWLDNGATNQHIGARFKGNSSYNGLRRSINLDIDFGITNADLMGFTTVNLNNANGDETVMREPIYFTVMSQYTPCPEGRCATSISTARSGACIRSSSRRTASLSRSGFPARTATAGARPTPAAE